jgi:hypothetical protein
MSVIREMVSRVETEQKAKLQQLKQMQEETKYFYNLLLSVYNHGVDYNHATLQSSPSVSSDLPSANNNSLM